jgi:hypothetical protein
LLTNHILLVDMQQIIGSHIDFVTFEAHVEKKSNTATMAVGKSQLIEIDGPFS